MTPSTQKLMEKLNVELQKNLKLATDLKAFREKLEEDSPEFPIQGDKAFEVVLGELWKSIGELESMISDLEYELGIHSPTDET